AFAAQDEARILERAAVLGHYVADAHVPLHAIVNYDGQLTGQKGVHARWESELVARFERQIESRVEPSAAVRIDDPTAFVFDVLRESFVRSPDALLADRETAGPRDYADTPEDDRYDDGYYSRFYEREGDTIVSRLDAAATALGSLWLSAWEDAGRPTLDEDFRFPYVRGETRLVLLRVPLAFEAAPRPPSSPGCGGGDGWAAWRRCPRRDPSRSSSPPPARESRRRRCSSRRRGRSLPSSKASATARTTAAT